MFWVNILFAKKYRFGSTKTVQKFMPSLSNCLSKQKINWECKCSIVTFSERNIFIFRFKTRMCFKMYLKFNWKIEKTNLEVSLDPKQYFSYSAGKQAGKKWSALTWSATWFQLFPVWTNKQTNKKLIKKMSLWWRDKARMNWSYCISHRWKGCPHTKCSIALTGISAPSILQSLSTW